MAVRPRLHHAATPVTNKPAASAVSIMTCGSATMVFAGDNSNARKARLSCPFDGPRTYRWKIEPQVLTALRRLDQHAAGHGGANATLLPKPRDARQQAVRAFDVFHADDMTIDDDDGLTDVKGTECSQHIAALCDVDAPHIHLALSR